MISNATPDAEALYRALRDHVQGMLSATSGSGSGSASGGAPWSIAGIYSGGAWIAERLAADLQLPHYGVINVAFHRDDYAKKGLHSQAQPSTLPFSVQDSQVLLIDDVLATGRTIRAAVNELFDYGRPARVALATLVDRGGRELPIAADFVGERITLPRGTNLVLSREGEGAGIRFTFATEALNGNHDSAAG
ncbi:bifunctional pyr operon transcriptional regulator/uracil phosphoribosyltransferase PyrR [Cupriavidus gilardii]|uniref:Bifunctional pyr operon transcriptional regulator/uracil phosphoribosyltransferase PyrR n=1 Tax=Cupriavidus gilardii TaxID=82541 RepID=A0ABY4VR07_9BURK|nr:bifunctional pyr operon transcriptional regulator/uracil phosphoribosyltransferase PyrR [Cupriavidus gilardii]MCT9071005.1 bifunctional pyr operon transcriptional regulator/uracil phosphoribosyltransferase PyrR [Cupriavidus gilardii]MCT9116461.1 bifunctional pyr operon transcriptional regulator/uracil phosphoribosyltransferase PyrR [Cupriavidus gilardii]MCT9125278.1 bifunctional pyr operon transcriptional regulator/uracil phosphoribosyltransferase PyrR [Cupriavidus gilardii]QKS62881.1 bifunc